jgi:hypothetical protein
VANFDREWPEPSPVPDDLVPAPAPEVARLGGTRVVAVVAGLSLLLAAGIGAALTSWLSLAPAPPATAPVAPREQIEVAPPQPVTRTVVYEVSGSAGDVGSVQFTDEDGDIITRSGVPLPWRTTFTMTGDRRPLVLVAQRKKGGTGEVTCSITYGGKVLTTVTTTGRYAPPQCSV